MRRLLALPHLVARAEIRIGSELGDVGRTADAREAARAGDRTLRGAAEPSPSYLSLALELLGALAGTEGNGEKPCDTSARPSPSRARRACARRRRPARSTSATSRWLTGA
ncbi:MAG: hypothetical protein U0166_18520 [Acidobacteriota bacterium]